jgi:hypothetical protein
MSQALYPSNGAAFNLEKPMRLIHQIAEEIETEWEKLSIRGQHGRYLTPMPGRI